MNCVLHQVTGNRQLTNDHMQAEAAQVRAKLKRQESEALAQKKQQEAQRTSIWHDMMKRMQPQQPEEGSPQEVAMMSARARERKVQEVLGPPPEPPLAPKGRRHTLSACPVVMLHSINQSINYVSCPWEPSGGSTRQFL